LRLVNVGNKKVRRNLVPSISCRRHRGAGQRPGGCREKRCARRSKPLTTEEPLDEIAEALTGGEASLNRRPR
jgi:hypothetical protein